MEIAPSFEGFVDFYKKNEELISEIAETAETAHAKVKALFERLKASREALKTMVRGINDLAFAVAADRGTREKQQELLQKIGKLSRDIQDFRDYPDIVAQLLLARGLAFDALAVTYTNAVAEIVTFTEGEVDHLKNLLRRAALDARGRQRVAALLDAAVQLSKLALKVGVKLAA